MTKETRVDVFDQLDSVSDLQVGDRVTFKAKRGEDMRMNSSFTYAGVRGGMLLTADGHPAATQTAFGSNISGWDETEWHVWRKTPVLPTGVGNIIYATKINGNHFQGSLILRPGGSWQSIYDPTIRFGATNIVEWTTAEIKINN